MSTTINFGIDLGTTNSSIAKYERGTVTVFKNPINLKQTLPSVVGFREQRTLIGDKARELLSKDSANVFSAFKRKIGTSDTYYIPRHDRMISPIELSSMILKELKNFVHSGEAVEASVVTIPASFDTMQSNATKEAAYAAGFSEVVLLQEPIAASLAFANQAELDLEDSQWLVYDFGGGTFDVALISIRDEEMKVLDHEGDNYLGGTDLDQAILEKILLPQIKDQGDFGNLLEAMEKFSGDYASYYNLLLYKAEELKIQLSHAETAELEVDLPTDSGELKEVWINVSRVAMEAAIQPVIEKTLTLCERVFQHNQLQKDQLRFILLVGGSTYVPAVRKALAERFGIEINAGIDPTTAVAAGAAYYAGLKTRQALKPAPVVNHGSGSGKTGLSVKAAYHQLSPDTKAPILLQFDRTEPTYQYRIYRSDGGFDTGLKPLQTQLSERLPLVEGAHNVFLLQVRDSSGQVVAHDLEEIGITQGKFRIDGQPLPFDIALELDTPENHQGGTYLEPIFRKGDILPLRQSIVKQISKNIFKNSEEELIINVLEGPIDNIPSANKSIGFIKISGEDLDRDLVRGSDVELEFTISESRDLQVEVFLSLSDQEFSESFNPSVSHIDLSTLRKELDDMSRGFDRKIEEMAVKEDYAQAGRVQNLRQQVEDLKKAVSELSVDDKSDRKYQLDQSKRQLATELHRLYGRSYLTQLIEKYYEKKKSCEWALESDQATPSDQARFEELIKAEKSTLAQGKANDIQQLIDQIVDLRSSINNRRELTDHDILFAWGHYRNQEYSNPAEAKRIFDEGDKAYAQRNVPRDLLPYISSLVAILKKDGGDDYREFGTGLR